MQGRVLAVLRASAVVERSPRAETAHRSGLLQRSVALVRYVLRSNAELTTHFMIADQAHNILDRCMLRSVPEKRFQQVAHSLEMRYVAPRCNSEEVLDESNQHPGVSAMLWGNSLLQHSAA